MLKNKTAVITGCNRGIGKAILQTFAENGANVFACVRKESPDFTAYIESLSARTGTYIQPVYFDLQDGVQIKTAVQTIFYSKKKIDILVNNAGVAVGGLFQISPIKEMKELFEINFFGQIQFTQELSRYMARFKKGSIINIGSTSGLIGNAGTVSYGSSKAALMYATKSMATELGVSNIRVNAIAPGITQTEMFEKLDEKVRTNQINATAFKRPANVSEIANVALFLASDLSSYLSGQVIRVDGGMTN
jgi:3-oxoacyl-[acyl-carrier protein] reductase